MDKLDAEIVNLRDRRDDLRKQMDVLEIELRAMERAAALRPAVEPPKDPAELSDEDTTDLKRGGRQPGAISQTWRKVLKRMHRKGPCSVDDICGFAYVYEISLKPSAAKERMSTYAEHGFVAEQAGYWTVTDLAVKRFGLTSEDTEAADDYPPQGSPTASFEGGVPSGPVEPVPGGGT